MNMFARKTIGVCICGFVMAQAGLAQAAIFVSGRTDAGTFTDVRNLGLSDGGVPSYNNVTGGASAAVEVGDRLRTVGIINLTTGNTAGINNSFPNGLVFVYAGLGTVTGVGAGPTITTTFDPGDPFGATGPAGNTVVGRLYDRSALTSGISGLNPFGTAGDNAGGNDNNNWVAGGVAGLGAFLAELTIAPRPDALQTGLPGPPDTQAHALLTNLAGINTTVAQPGAAFADVATDFKFDVTNPGTFFSNPFDVTPNPAAIPDLSTATRLFDSFMVSIEQQVDPKNPLEAGFLNPDVADLNSIATALIGTGFTSGDMGGTYTPALADLASGDGAARNQGGNATPGAQFEAAGVPEIHASAAQGAVVLLIGAFLVLTDRRRAILA
jgi:hypothetical protein